MKIGIVGAGSIGMLTAKLLEDHGHQVTLIARTQKESPLLFQTPEGTTELLSLSISTDWHASRDADMLIIATKAYDLPSVFPNLEEIQIPIVFLQNGLVKDLVSQHLQNTSILFGSIDHGAGRDSELLTHNGIGSIKVGGNEDYRGLIEKLSPVIQWEEDIENILLRKAALNTLINPLTAIMDVPNGDLSSNAHLQKAVIAHYDELVMGIPLLEELVTIEEVFQLIKRTAANTSSMRKDIQNGSQSEASYILLPLLQLAEEKGNFLPITSYLYNLIQSK